MFEVSDNPLELEGRPPINSPLSAKSKALHSVLPESEDAEFS